MMVGPAGFSFVELLIALSLLAAMVYLALAFVPLTREEIHSTVSEKEMTDIQSAFGRLAEDMVLNDVQLDDFGEYGVWGLMQSTHPDGGTDLSPWDPAQRRGWRGPYVAVEATARIDPTAPGQPDGAVEVPVLLDPYGNRYRVLIPDAGGNRQQHLALISTGSDGELDTIETAVDGEIEAAGDDTVRRLLPLAP
jgi:hypothetical protein